MKPYWSRLLLGGCGVALVGVGLVFAALVSHSNRVFAVDHLAGTEHHDLMVRLSAATPGERRLLVLGALTLICGLLLLVLGWIQRSSSNARLLAATTASHAAIPQCGWLMRSWETPNRGAFVARVGSWETKTTPPHWPTGREQAGAALPVAPAESRQTQSLVIR